MVSGKTLPSFDTFDTRPIAGGYIGGRFLTGINPQVSTLYFVNSFCSYKPHFTQNGNLSGIFLSLYGWQRRSN